MFGFFDSIEILSKKIYKDFEDLDYCGKIEAFIDCGIEFFTEFVQQQIEEKENAI